MPSVDYSLKEIVEMALQVEVSGEAFYRRLKELASADAVRDLFAFLEKEERHHAEEFTALLKRAEKRKRPLAFSAAEEELLYLRAFADRRIFMDPAQAAKLAETFPGLPEALDFALDFEIKSVAFYQEMALRVEEPQDRRTVLELERHEKDHAALLYKMKKSL